MKTIFTFILLFIVITGYSQCMQIPVALGQLTDSAELIIEADVVSSQAEWNSNRTLIHTSHQLVPLTVYKGMVDVPIVVKTLGGQVDLTKMVVHPEAELQPGDTGIFFLTKQSDGTYEIYASSQGYYKYQAVTNEAANGFERFSIEDEELPTLLHSLTGMTPNTISESENFRMSPNNGFQNANISSISPTTAYAGQEVVLTINGSDFGAMQGESRVLFTNADSGGGGFSGPTSTQYILWTDTQIQVEIPDFAGTGEVIVQIRDENQNVIINYFSSVLNIPFSQINFSTSSNPEIAYSALHIDQNGAGGYGYRLNADFSSNIDATNRFVETLAQWTSTTGMNWDVSGASPSTEVANLDGESIVNFDGGLDSNGNPVQLPAGVLGRATSGFSATCSIGGEFVWHVSSVDLIFDAETNWSFSSDPPGAGEFDFYSVSLHELGHAHQLGHVINTSSVMHFAFGPNSTSRTLTADEITGASDLIDEATGGVCFQGIHDKILTNPVNPPAETNTTYTFSNLVPQEWHSAADGDDIVVQINPGENSGIATVEVCVYLTTEDVFMDGVNSAKRRVEVSVFDSAGAEFPLTSPITLRFLYTAAELDDLVSASEDLTAVEDIIMVKNDQICGADFDIGEPSNLEMEYSFHPLGGADYMLEVENINSLSSFYLVDNLDQPVLISGTIYLDRTANDLVDGVQFGPPGTHAILVNNDTGKVTEAKLVVETFNEADSGTFQFEGEQNANYYVVLVTPNPTNPLPVVGDDAPTISTLPNSFINTSDAVGQGVMQVGVPDGISEVFTTQAGPFVNVDFGVLKAVNVVFP